MISRSVEAATQGCSVSIKDLQIVSSHIQFQRNIRKENNMPGKDNFYVNNKYLKNANYSLALGSDTYIAAFRERIVAGPTELCPESGDVRFTKKAIIIPSNVYFAFTNAVRKGLQGLHPQGRW